MEPTNPTDPTTQPNNTLQPDAVPPVAATLAPAETTPATPPPVDSPHPDSRRYLVAFLLTITPFAMLGLRPFYTRDKIGGIIRLLLSVFGILFMIGPVISLLSGAPVSYTGFMVLYMVGLGLLFISAIWTIVDFFYTFFAFRKGKPGVTSSEADKKWTLLIFIATIICYFVSAIFL